MVDLSSEEVALAREIVETAYRDLKEEIYKTEETGYKARLKQREAVQESLLAKLTAGVGRPPLVPTTRSSRPALRRSPAQEGASRAACSGTSSRCPRRPSPRSPAPSAMPS